MHMNGLLVVGCADPLNTLVDVPGTFNKSLPSGMSNSMLGGSVFHPMQ